MNSNRWVTPSPTALDAGSVLVEALVAVAIMAITLTFAAQTIGDGVRRARAGERTRMAALEAQSRLAEVGGDIALAPGRSSGEDAGLLWRVEISPAANLATRTVRLLAVSVVVADREGRPLVTLRSLRLGGAT